MFGGVNIIGTVDIMLGLEKIVLAVLVMFRGYRLWNETWRINKLYMIVPVLGLVSVAILFPEHNREQYRRIDKYVGF